MALRRLTIKPSGADHSMPKDGLLSKTYRIGKRFQLIINQRLGDLTGVELTSSMHIWKPHQPTWDELSGAERGDYRWARDHFAQIVADITGKEVIILENDT